MKIKKPNKLLKFNKNVKNDLKTEKKNCKIETIDDLITFCT